jgi:FdhE protein
VTTDTPATADKIRNAARQLIDRNPAYAAILSFYTEVFVAQENARTGLQLVVKPIDAAQRRAKSAGRLPLIEPRDFPIDAAGARALLDTVLALTQDGGGELAASATRLASSLTRDEGLATRLFNALITEDEAALAATADQIGVPAAHLAFLSYHAVRPSLITGAELLATDWAEAVDWNQGYCPICGSPPVLSLLQADGRRALVCRFCWHQWNVPRQFCPLCNNPTPRGQNYFTAQGDKAWRVDFCESCKGYIKTVDTREIARYCYAPLEQVATLHLDIKAQELGFAGGWPPPASP